jgi:hypothetical protein
MKHRVLDLFLVLTIAAGGVLAWQTGRERSRLEAQHARLVRTTGDLPVGDASKVHVLALDAADKAHFAWRMYFPPKTQQVLRGRHGGSSTSWSSGPSEFIARVRFREDDQGILNVYTHFGGSSSRMGIGDKALAGLLRGRWDRVRVEQLGALDLAVIKPDQPAVLLRLTLPDDLQREAAEKLPSYERSRFVPVLFELNLGPEASKP